MYAYPYANSNISDMGASVNLSNIARQNEQMAANNQLRSQAIESMNLYSRGVPGVGYQANAPLSMETAATILGIPYTQKYEAGGGGGGGGYTPEPTSAQIDIQNSQASMADEQARAARENRQGKLPEMSDEEKLKATGEQRMKELGVNEKIAKAKIDAVALQDDKKFQQQEKLLQEKLAEQFKISTSKGSNVPTFDQRIYLQKIRDLAQKTAQYNRYVEGMVRDTVKNGDKPDVYDVKNDPFAQGHLQEINQAKQELEDMKSKIENNMNKNKVGTSSQNTQTQKQSKPTPNMQGQPATQNMGFNPNNYNRVNPYELIPLSKPITPGIQPYMNVPYAPQYPQDLSYYARNLNE